MCTAHLGMYLMVTGRGRTKKCADGIVLLGAAAAKGSNFAAWKLGMAYAEGKYGLSHNRDEAIHWLKKATQDECKYDHFAKAAEEDAKVKLDELVGFQEVTP